MPNRPTRYDANLPRNLTYRKARQSYYWRNPVTGQELSLGRISRREAVAQAREANNFIEQNDIPSALLDRLKEAPQFTFLNGLKGTTSFLRVETSSRTP